VAHLLHHLGQRNPALVVKFQHQQQGVLHQGQPGVRLPVAVGFLVWRVRGVVGGNDVEPVVEQGFEEGLFVPRVLDGRVALDAVAEPFVVARVEPEVVHAHFGRNALLGQGHRVGEQGQLVGVEMCRMCSRVLYSLASATANDEDRRQAASSRTSGWMAAGASSPYCWRYFSALARTVASSSQCVAISIGLSRKRARRVCSLSTSMLPVDEPMNTLMPHTVPRVGLHDLGQVVVGGAHEEGVVGQGFSGGQGVLVGEQRPA
jgi:hypothetical protein